MIVRDACPACSSQQFKKNGHTHTGKQNHRCQQCGRHFVGEAENRLIDAEQRTLVGHLLLEKIALHGRCRAVGVSIQWLMDFMIARFEAAPEHLHVQLPGHPHEVLLRRVEADEMCSFVKKTAHKQWLWLAMDKTTGQIMAYHVGDRSRDSARQLWANLPTVYREQATFYTDPYEVYKGVIPAEQHKAITKPARLPVGAGNPGVLQESRASHRSDPLFNLPLQPHKSCSITSITLPKFLQFSGKA
jgi:insertion element IS1 protein InsB